MHRSLYSSSSRCLSKRLAGGLSYMLRAGQAFHMKRNMQQLKASSQGKVSFLLGTITGVCVIVNSLDYGHIVHIATKNLFDRFISCQFTVLLKDVCLRHLARKGLSSELRIEPRFKYKLHVSGLASNETHCSSRLSFAQSCNEANRVKATGASDQGDEQRFLEI